MSFNAPEEMEDVGLQHPAVPAIVSKKRKTSTDAADTHEVEDFALQPPPPQRMKMANSNSKDNNRNDSVLQLFSNRGLDAQLELQEIKENTPKWMAKVSRLEHHIVSFFLRNVSKLITRKELKSLPGPSILSWHHKDPLAAALFMHAECPECKDVLHKASSGLYDPILVDYDGQGLAKEIQHMPVACALCIDRTFASKLQDIFSNNEEKSLPLNQVSRRLMPACPVLALSYLRNVCKNVLLEQSTIKWISNKVSSVAICLPPELIGKIIDLTMELKPHWRFVDHASRCIVDCPRLRATDNGLLAVSIDEYRRWTLWVPEKWPSGEDIFYRLEIEVSDTYPAHDFAKFFSNWSFENVARTCEIRISAKEGTHPQNRRITAHKLVQLWEAPINKVELVGVTPESYSELQYSVESSTSRWITTHLMPNCQWLGGNLSRSCPKLKEIVTKRCTGALIESCSVFLNSMKLEKLSVCRPEGPAVPLKLSAPLNSTFADSIREIDLIGVSVEIRDLQKSFSCLERLNLIDTSISYSHLELLLQHCPALKQVKINLDSRNWGAFENKFSMAAMLRRVLSTFCTGIDLWSNVHITLDGALIQMSRQI